MLNNLTKLMSLEQWWFFVGVDLLLLALLFVPTRYLLSRWASTIGERNIATAAPADATWFRRLLWFLARAELWTLFLLIPLFLAPSATSTYIIVSLGFLLAWLIRRFGRGVWTLPSPFDWLAISLVVLSGLSFLLHGHWDVSFPYLFRFWSGLGFMYLILNWVDSDGRAKFFAYFIGWYGVLFAFASPWLMMRSNKINLFWEMHTALPRLPDVLLKPPINANTYADILLLTVPFLFFVLSDLWKKKRWSAYLCWSVLFLGFLWENIVFVVADSRFAYLILALVTISWLLAIYRRWWFAFAQITCTFFLVVAIIFLTNYFHFWQYLSVDILSARASHVFFHDADLQRTVWVMGRPLLLLLPYWGLGPHMYSALPLLGLANLCHRLLFRVVIGQWRVLGHFGVAFLVLFVFILLSAFFFVYLAWRRFRSKGDPSLVGLALFFFFITPFLLLYGARNFAGWLHRGAMVVQFSPQVAVDALGQAILLVEWFLRNTAFLWLGFRIVFLFLLFVVAGWLWFSVRRRWAKIIGAVGLLIVVIFIAFWIEQSHSLDQFGFVLSGVQNGHVLWYHSIDARLMTWKIGRIIFLVTPYFGLGPNIYAVLPIFWAVGHYASLAALAQRAPLGAFSHFGFFALLLSFVLFVGILIFVYWAWRRFRSKVHLSWAAVILLVLLALSSFLLWHLLHSIIWQRRMMALAAFSPNWSVWQRGITDFVAQGPALSIAYWDWLALFFAFWAQNVAFLWVYAPLTYLVAFLVLRWWLLRASRRRLPVIGSLILFVAAFVSLLIWYPWGGRHIYLFFHGIELRGAIWRIGFELLLMVPYLGLGPNLYSTLLLSISDTGDLGRGTLMHAHNIYLQTALDFGLPAMLLVLAIFLGTLILSYWSWRRFRSWNNASLALLPLAVFLAVASFLLHGFVDIAGWQQRVTMFIWFFPGLAVALYRLSEHVSQQPHQ